MFSIFTSCFLTPCDIDGPWFLANVNSRSPSLYVVVRPSVCHLSSVVCLSVCLSSVTFVRPTQATEIFGNVFTPFGTMAISNLSVKILRRSSQGNPSVEGGKPKRVAILDISKAISRKRCKIAGNYYYSVIGSRIWAFDWYQTRWPWMILNDVIAVTSA